MNKCFKVIFNRSRKCFMVVNEKTSSAQKSAVKVATLLSLVVLLGDSSPVFAATYSPVWGEVSHQNSIALGTDVNTKGQRIVAIGYGAQAGYVPPESDGTASPLGTANGAIALGNMSRVYSSAGDGVALGSNAMSVSKASVAIGAESYTDRVGGAQDYVTFTNTEKEGVAWVSARGAVAIGSDSEAGSSGIFTRQLTGLAAGSKDTDAVNVAQLKDLQSSTVFGTGASTEITPASEGVDAVHAQKAAVFGNLNSR